MSEARALALQALLMQPLMRPDHAAFIEVRRHADALRDWLARECGWTLVVGREGARLFKRPSDTRDASRGVEGFTRERYTLLCLTAAVLERAEAQITLRVLSEELLRLASDTELTETGFAFTLESAVQRRDLVQVCRHLVALGVLHRVAGDEDSWLRPEAGGDALYDVQRPLLALLFAGQRGPSTWPAESAPSTLEARLASLVDEPRLDTPESRRNHIRHQLARRLMDDPVIYTDELDAESRDYFISQRGLLAARLAEFTGLVVENRAEGSALIDVDDGDWSDLPLPAEGTEAHATLLVAEHLAMQAKANPDLPVADAELHRHLRVCAESFQKYWKKDARELGAERALLSQALARLEGLKLIRRSEGGAIARPALHRYAADTPTIAQAGLHL